MRKGYGALLAVFVAFSVLVGPRPDTSGSRAGQGNPSRADSGQISAERFANENFTTCKTDADKESPCADCNPFCPARDLLDIIEAHYGEPAEKKLPAAGTSPKNYDRDKHWSVPEGENQKILFVIATVPDPVHTHMSLTFDRTIEAIQKAAQQARYLFSRATMPWDPEERVEATDVKVRLAQQLYQEHREEFPGLMIFRKVQSARDAAAGGMSFDAAAVRPGDPMTSPSTLFVLVVGETPTGGIHKDQFANAVRMIRQIRGNDETAPTLKTLRILGTAFSGSLSSLERSMDQQLLDPLEFPEIVIHSGTASSWKSTEEFRAFLKKGHRNAKFATFQESDAYADEHFRCYVETQGYDAKEIAILSEDETAYGNQGDEDESGNPASSPPCKRYPRDPDPELRQMVRLYFPRDISQLRAAYQRDLRSQDSGMTGRKAPRTTLPLNLDTTGHNDDSVAPYARLQTPLSQEAVLLGIVGNLRRHHTRFVLVRASNSLDTLFLCQFLRTVYPDGQLVTIGSNLLFQRDQDQPSLHGVLAITTYPLLPGIDDSAAHLKTGEGTTHVDHIFPDSYSVGNFNAFLSLLYDLPKNFVEPATPERRVADLPEAAYAQYGWPALSPDAAAALHSWTPPLWLTVLGQGGFWPVTLLDEHSASTSRLASVSNLHAVAANPEPGKFYLPTPMEWQVFCFLSLCLVFPFSWLMAIPPEHPRSELLANFTMEEDALRDKLLFSVGLALLAIQFVFLYPWILWGGDFDSALNLFLLPSGQIVLLVLGCTAGLLRRQSRRLAIRYFALALAAIFLAVGFRIFFDDRPLPPHTHFSMYRSTHLLSGSSPLFPILFLLLAGLWWGWLSLQGVILRGRKGPVLPSIYEFDEPKAVLAPIERMRLKALSKQSHKGLMHALKPFAFDLRVYFPAGLVLAAAVLVLGWHHSVQALDGTAYEILYSLLFFFMLALLLTLVFRVLLVWMEFRDLLRALEDLPLRRSFDRLQGFAWTSLWKMAGSAGSSLTNFYRLITRELECLRSLLNMRPDDCPVGGSIRLTEDQANAICAMIEKRRLEQTEHAEGTRFKWRKAPQYFRLKLRGIWKSLRAGAKKNAVDDSSISTSDSASGGKKDGSGKKALQYFHRQLADTAAACLIYLNGQWKEEQCPGPERNKEKVKSGATATEDQLEPVPSSMTVCAERFVCLFFVAFILVILQRIQTLVVCAAGVFLFVLLSLGSYPFEPHLRLRSLMIFIFFLILVVVGFVFAQMHKNSMLSRITKTNPGELGLDFWLRMGTFVLVPLLGVLAAQFPEINGFLFSWLEPAMQSLK